MRAVLPVVLLAACGAPPADLLAPGPYQAGYRELSFSYDPGDGPREIRLPVWYPTEQGPDVGTLRYDDRWPAANIAFDAPVADGSFPLAVYSHGHQGYAESSSQLLIHAVRHGMVVVAPEHTGNVGPFQERSTDIYWKRPLDVSAALDVALAADFPLAGSLSDDPVLAIGHSFGGYSFAPVTGAIFDDAAFQRCADGEESDFCSTMTAADEAILRGGFEDDRFAGFLSMDSGDHRLFGDAGVGAIDVPFFFLSGLVDYPERRDDWWPPLDREGNTLLTIADAGHLAFTDFAPRNDSEIVPETGWAAMGAWVKAFQVRLAGDDRYDPWFEGEEAPWGGVGELTPGR